MTDPLLPLYLAVPVIALIVAGIVYLPVRFMLRRGIVKDRLGVIIAYVGLTQAFALPLFLMMLYRIFGCTPETSFGPERPPPCYHWPEELFAYLLGGLSLLLLMIAPVIAAMMVKPARGGSVPPDN